MPLKEKKPWNPSLVILHGAWRELLKEFGDQNSPKNQCGGPPFLVVMSQEARHPQPCQSYP